jgi:ribonuclease E
VAEVPAAIIPAAPAAPEDIDTTLQQAGLVMIQTTGTPSPVVASVPSQPLGRKPKAAPVIADEPLQMVETRRE